MLGAPGALQGLGDLVLTMLTMGIAELRQREGITFPSENRLEDRHARNARQITHDRGECEVHLLQGLMHRLNMVRAVGQEHLAVASRATQHTDLIGGAESGGEQAIGVQALEPLAVEPIGFWSSGGAFGLTGVDEEDLDAAGLQEFESGNPVAPGGFPGHGGDAAVEEPVGEGIEVGGEGAETAHGLRVATRGHGHPVLGFAEVDAGGMGVAGLECVGEHGQRREQRGRWTRGFKARVFRGCHSGLQKQETTPRTAVGAGVTAKRAVSQPGSGRGLSPMLWSPTPETNLTNGHIAPMRGRSRRPTGCPRG